MILPFGCYLHRVELWSMQVRYEFYGYGADPKGDLEQIVKRTYYLYKNETTLVCELKGHELTQLKEFLKDYQEPPQLRATKA